MPDIEVKKSYQEINEKIRKGSAVVVTAEEMPRIVESEGTKKAFEKVDVVTTGTFGTMCSSGAFINFGHTKPKIRANNVWFNDVLAYGAVAAVDCFLGATQVKAGDPLNAVHPGEFKYGGGHVIEDLIAGRELKFRAESYGTDCYPLKEIEKTITINDLRNAFLYNPRNSYQGYNCAVNATSRTVYTYMGILKPGLQNATYSSAGELSPLMNDPYYWTIGSGTRIFLGGAAGAVTWHGTQHAPGSTRGANGVPREGAGTIAVTGDMKEMSTDFIRGASITGYGTSLMVGVGIPIPIINEEMAFFTGVRNRDIYYPVIDYGRDYPEGRDTVLGEVNCLDLMSGTIEVAGRKVPSAPLSSYPMARKIAAILKEWVEGGFTLGEPAVTLPSVKAEFKRG